MPCYIDRGTTGTERTIIRVPGAIVNDVGTIAIHSTGPGRVASFNNNVSSYDTNNIAGGTYIHNAHGSVIIKNMLRMSSYLI